MGALTASSGTECSKQPSVEKEREKILSVLTGILPSFGIWKYQIDKKNKSGT